jgi:hypothetical protein
MDDFITLADHLCLTRNESQIIDVLVDHDLFFRDLSLSQAAAFLHDEDFHLVLYFADDRDRGFQMYVVQDFSVNVLAMIQLSGVFRDLIGAGYQYQLFASAKAKTDQMIHMAATFRALFQKTLPDF